MVTPYIVFHGQCADALSFYSKIFETKVRMQQTYGDYIPEGSAVEPGTLSNWILHAEMEIAGTAFWFADEGKRVERGNMVKLTVHVPNKGAAQRIFDGLSDGGEIILPPTETFYSTFHASTVDPFGVPWEIVAEEAPGKAGL